MHQGLQARVRLDLLGSDSALLTITCVDLAQVSVVDLAIQSSLYMVHL